MKKYLAIHEAPCVGTAEIIFEAVDDAAAERKAWSDSLNSRYYVTGGYDLYRLEYNPYAHTHILVPVEHSEEGEVNE